MAYVAPVAADLKARFPEFAAVSDTLVNLVLAEAIAEAGDHWREDDRKPAQLYLAAHLLASEGEPQRTSSGDGIGASGPVKRDRVGDAETEYAGAGSSASGASTSTYGGTIYGRRFEAIMRRNVPTVAVV